MNIQLKKFDPSKMADDKVCVFIGKRGTGKSTLVTDILWHKKHLPAGIAMSGTEEGNGHYKQFVPDLFVYSDYNRDAVEKIIDRQKKNLAAGRASPVFILMDDCMYDRSFMRDTVIRQLFMNGRHWKIFFMMTTQYCMDMTPMIRTNVDYVFVLRDNVRQNRVRKITSVLSLTTRPKAMKSRTVCFGTRRPYARTSGSGPRPCGSIIKSFTTRNTAWRRPRGSRANPGPGRSKSKS